MQYERMVSIKDHLPTHGMTCWYTDRLPSAEAFIILSPLHTGSSVHQRTSRAGCPGACGLQWRVGHISGATRTPTKSVSDANSAPCSQHLTRLQTSTLPIQRHLSYKRPIVPRQGPGQGPATRLTGYGFSTTLMHLSFLSRKVLYISGAFSKGTVCEMTKDGSISPASIFASRGFR